MIVILALVCLATGIALMALNWRRPSGAPSRAEVLAVIVAIPFLLVAAALLVRAVIFEFFPHELELIGRRDGPRAGWVRGFVLAVFVAHLITMVGVITAWRTRLRGALEAGAAAALTGFVILGGFSIGALFFPGVLVLLLASALAGGIRPNATLRTT